MANLIVAILIIELINISVNGQYEFSLNFSGRLDPDWVYAEYSVGSKTECASLCFKDSESCFYFGHEANKCKLLTNSVDENICSTDNCDFPKIKIYKLKREKRASEDSAEYFDCSSEDDVEASIECRSAEFLLRGIGSRSPFFGDVLGCTCTKMDQGVYDLEERELQFFSSDSDLSLIANCESEDEIITKFKLCITDPGIPVAITVSCSTIKNPEWMESTYNVTSDEMKHTLIDCGDSAAIQKIYFEDVKSAIRVTFTCIMLNII
ncbi:uncharacterized protein LOC118181812 [Stegodyphus dumicola]|uniref:uncharacterized protein LOC118181812 n=1 Tax=Stegodyphus dumicola TaxID=202533 RepID=UPI0015A8EFEE|nr:uncharacterized protein LOC118181812 [Stegodyphus dumicola]